MDDIITLGQFQRALLVTKEFIASNHLMEFCECLADESYQPVDLDSSWNDAKDMWIGQLFFGVAVDENGKPISEVATLIGVLFRDKERAKLYSARVNDNSEKGVSVPVIKLVASKHSPITYKIPLEIERGNSDD